MKTLSEKNIWQNDIAGSVIQTRYFNFGDVKQHIKDFDTELREEIAIYYGRSKSMEIVIDKLKLKHFGKELVE